MYGDFNVVPLDELKLVKNMGAIGNTPTPVYRYAFINCDTGTSVYGWSIKWGTRV